MRSPEDRCPCLSGNTFGTCCGPLLSGERHAATAEQLMRSRFTAFAVGDAAYLLRTWHPNTRPASFDLDPARHWYRLDIVWAERGGVLDSDGQVSFRAYFRHPDGPGEQAEVGRFVREDKKWFYLNGQ
ncbi:YchJ family protein [Aeromicrobium sp.]